MARGKSGSAAAEKATQTATTRTASGGEMKSAAGLIQEAQKQAEAMSPLEVAELPRIALDRIGPHPLNPEHRHLDESELTELAANIELVGVLTAPLVVSRASILSFEPEMAELIPEEHEVILIDGHRRWGASKLAAGVTDLPYILREELADPAVAAAVFLATNILGKRLSPIEEARGYLRLQTYAKISQSELAATVGFGQPRISKSMQLLKLPKVVQDAVDARTVSPHAARELLSLAEDSQESVFLEAIASLSEEERDRPDRVAEAVRVSVNKATVRAEKEAAAAAARKALAEGSIAEIDPKELFGADAWQHELRDTELDEVQTAGKLAGAVVHDTGRVTYYSQDAAPRFHVTEAEAEEAEEGVADVADHSNGIVSEPEGGGEAGYSNGIADVPAPHDPADVEAIDQALRAAKSAHEDRLAAMRRLVAKAPDNGLLADVLADAVLAAHWVDFEDATEFAEGAGYNISAESIEATLATANRADIQRVAFAAALGALEAEAARDYYATNGPWPMPVQRHVKRLAALGHYTLADYDHAHLSDTENP